MDLNPDRVPVARVGQFGDELRHRPDLELVGIANQACAKAGEVRVAVRLANNVDAIDRSDADRQIEESDQLERDWYAAVRAVPLLLTADGPDDGVSIGIPWQRRACKQVARVWPKPARATLER